MGGALEVTSHTHTKQFNAKQNSSNLGTVRYGMGDAAGQEKSGLKVWIIVSCDLCA